MHRRFTMKDGLPSNKVYSVTQDSKGFIWFGTDAGACRFDGSRFERFSMQDGLPDDEVLNIAEDSRGRIWFLTLSGKLCYWDEDGVHTEIDIPGLKLQEHFSGWHSFCEDRSGRIWIGGVQGGVLRLTPGGEVDSVYAWCVGIFSVVKDDRDSIVIFQTKNIHEVSGDSVGPMVRHEAIFHLSLILGRPRGDRRPLVLRDEGIMSYGAEGFRMVVPADGTLKPLVHRYCKEDDEGDIWVLRSDHGIDVHAAKEQAWRHLFANEKVNAVLVDREGLRWLCTDAGVLLFTKAQQAVSIIPVAEREGSSALLRATDGRLWIGGDKGAVMVSSSEGLRRSLRPDPAAGSQRIREMAEDRTGRVWIASDFTLFRAGPGPDHRAQLVPFKHPVYYDRPMVSGGARGVLCRRDGSVLVSNSGFEIVQPSKWGLIRTRYRNDLFPHLRTLAMEEDRSGGLWFAMEDGVHLEKDGVLRSFQVQDGRPTTRVSDMVLYQGDTLAVSTDQGGVLLMHQGEVLVRHDHAVPKAVARLRVIGDTIWACGPVGAYGFVLRAQELVQVALIDLRSGLPGDDVRDITSYGTGFALAVEAGVAVVKDVLPFTTAKAPWVYLAAVDRNDTTELSPKASSYVMDRSESLNILARAVEYMEPELLEFQVSLDGGHVWLPMPQGQWRLIQMKAGEFTIAVRARKNGGEWSVPIVRGLIVTPHWYETTWVIGSFIGVLVAILIGIGILVQRGVQRRQLQRMQARQLLQEERRRIAADMHDDLGADLSLLWGQARSLQAGEGDAGQLAEGIGKSMERIDDIIWSLDPERDNVRSTADFIEGWVRNYTHANGLSFRSRIHVPTVACALPTQQRRELALVVKEALRNIVKHADAGTVQLGIRLDAGIMQVMVQDDGSHSPLNQNSGRRSGSANMERRMERIGGRMRWEAVAPQGTRLVLEMDLDPSEWVM